jgi:Protein of unknown function (DUF2889)
MSCDQRVFRRRVLLRGCTGVATADVEDDQHRFGVDVSHDGHVVTTITARALRTPWTTCALAAASLDTFVGIHMPRSPFAALRHVRLAHQCTHMADMASLAIAAAARQVLHRVYDVEIRRNTEDDRGGGASNYDAKLMRDGSETSRWRIRDRLIVEPVHLRGLEIFRASSWVGEKIQDEEAAEELFVLQRGVLVAGGGEIDLDLYESPSGSAWIPGACFAFQPDRAALGRRNKGNTFDFTERPEALLADLEFPLSHPGVTSDPSA